MTTRAFAAAFFAATFACACGKTSLRFTPDVLPEGRVGQPYRAVVGVKEAHTPVGGMGVVHGALPPGLDLRFDRDVSPDGTRDAGLIEGTPQKAGEYTFVVDAWCYGTNISGQTGRREFRIVIR